MVKICIVCFVDLNMSRNIGLERRSCLGLVKVSMEISKRVREFSGDGFSKWERENI